MLVKTLVKAEPLFATKRVRSRRSFADEVVEMAAALGWELMPWQVEVLESGLEVRSTGRFYHHDVVVTVPRQQGKSVLVACVAAWWALKWPGSNIMFLAQTRTAASSRLQGLAVALRAAGVEGVKWYRGVGNEQVRFENGSRILVESPNIHGSHGESFDLVVLDEAWSYEEHVLQGVLPTQTARPNSQLWLISTQGTEDSEVWNRYVVRGRESVSDRGSLLAYTEYAADVAGGDDVLLEEHWARWMPALGFTVEVENMRSAFESMLAPEFRRGYGNVMTATEAELFPAGWWSDTYDPYVKVSGDLVLAFDVNYQPAGGAVVAVFPTDDEGVHVDVLAYESGGDLGWLEAEMKAAVDRYRPVAVACAGGSPVRAVAQVVEAYCEQRAIPFRSLSGQDLGAAAGLLYDGVRARSFSHGDSVALDAAAKRAVVKRSADLWRFDREAMRVDVSALVAASVGVFVAAEFAAKRRVPVIY